MRSIPDTSPDTSNLLNEQQMLASKALAVVVCRLFPHVILAGGGRNSFGFYYDFIFESPLTANILELIEVELYRFIKEEHPVRGISMMRENAQSLLTHHGHFLLAEQAGDERSNVLSLVQIGDFFDLCPPLVIDNTLEIGHVKIFEYEEVRRETQSEELLVTRFLGTSRPTARDLKGFVKTYLSYTKKVDHRLLGPKLNLFNFLAPGKEGGVFWHPKGMQLRALLLDLLKQKSPHAEIQVSTPLNFALFDEEEERLRSSFLPAHLQLLNSPLMREEGTPRRVTEYGQLFCHTPESLSWGLFCQNDFFADQTTLCCTKEQVVSELISSLHFIEQIITIFPFEAQWHFIASRQKSAKARHEQEALRWLKEALHSRSFLFSSVDEIEEEEEGEGARLELRIKDGIGREWPVSKLCIPSVESIRSLLPRVGMRESESGSITDCVIVTCSVFGSIDRFAALVIEQYQGFLPLWIAPEQVRVMVIGKNNEDYAKDVCQRLQSKGLRVKLDVRQDKLSLRIHQAEKENIPYLVLIGEQERMKQMINVRSSERFGKSHSVDVETFLNEVFVQLR